TADDAGLWTLRAHQGWEYAESPHSLALTVTAVDYSVVIYNLHRREVTVGHQGNPYAEEFFDNDGNFIIRLEDNAFFPYEVQFQYGGTTIVEWFYTPESNATIGRHTFGVYSQTTDPDETTQINFFAGGVYTTVYPHPKTFTNDPPMPVGRSLMPLPYRRFNVDLSHLSPPELRLVRLDMISIDTNHTDRNPRDFQVIRRYDEHSRDELHGGDGTTPIAFVVPGYIDLMLPNVWEATGYLELITGDGSPFSLGNRRYIIDITTQPTSVLNEWLNFEFFFGDPTLDISQSVQIFPNGPPTITQQTQGVFPNISVFHFDIGELPPPPTQHSIIFWRLSWGDAFRDTPRSSRVRIFNGFLASYRTPFAMQINQLFPVGHSEVTSTLWNHNPLVLGPGSGSREPVNAFVLQENDGDVSMILSGLERFAVQIHRTASDPIEQPDRLPLPEATLNITGAAEIDLGDTYVLPIRHDTYSYNRGFQTVLTTNSTPGLLLSLRPTFTTPPGYRVFAGHDGEAGAQQTSGINSHNFAGGWPVLYSTISPDDRQRNYWVTFVQKHLGGPQLFINGVNSTNAENFDALGRPIRDVFFDRRNVFHDILITNIGDAPITGLRVEAVNPDRFTLYNSAMLGHSSGHTLLPFATATRDNQYGELQNVVRLRLHASGDTGAVSGVLRISYDIPGGGREQREISISGHSVSPNIVTERLRPAVRFVPYSALIQSDNESPVNMVTWTVLDPANLPPGITLNTDTGELYGVPMTYGDYTFTVRMQNSDPSFDDDHATFTLEILENTDLNVDWATQYVNQGFPIDYRLPDVITLPVDDDLPFISVGDYEYFIDMWLNGVLLTRDIDYFAEEGSTVITVRAQTFNEHPAIQPGRNTIAAEFRETETNSLRRSAQNFYIVEAGGTPPNPLPPPNPPNPPDQPNNQPTAPSGPSGHNDSDSSSSPPPAAAATPETTAATQATATTQQQAEGMTRQQFAALFDDLSINDWFLDALFFMFQRGLMVGMDDRLFGPNDTSSRAMLVTVLHRASGTPSAGIGTFNDVDSGAWYADSVAWAQANGIVVGTGNGQFSPGENISRQDLATILFNFAVATGAELPNAAPFDGFTDQADVADYAAHAIEHLFKAEIISGHPDGSFNPRGNATRAEMATMLQRFLQATE
ncbi:MAG: S-layer homology domain-containing protein, partial [Defluviitaleaceae bacterium]|nr:S-layer homology domain-containing protein [Defluviitaleaceae bacterium]